MPWLRQLRDRHGAAEDLLSAGGGGQRDLHGLVVGVGRLHPAVEHDLRTRAVVGHRHDRGEADVELGDRARVADPLGDVAAAETHGQHAVGDRGVQTDLLGDLVVPVDRVEVAGDPGVVHQIRTGQGDDSFGQLVAHLDRTELTQCHR